MRIFILLVLFVSSVAKAQTSLGRTVSGGLILNSSCDEIEEEMISLINWTKKLERRDCQARPIKISSEGLCTADVTDCVPSHVKKYQGLTSADNGPNCWNLALTMGQLVPMLRESSMDEWEFYLTSPLCRELASHETPESGDIGSVEARLNGDKGHIHGFMYISPTLVYSKNGTNLKSPYAVQSLERMKEVYSVGDLPPGECKTDCGPQVLAEFLSDADQKKFPKGVPGSEICYANMTLGPVLKAACAKLIKYVKENEQNCRDNCTPSSLHYYRCQSFDDFYSKQDLHQKTEMDAINGMIQKAESCTQKALFGEEDAGSTRELVSDHLKVLNAYLAQESKLRPESEEEKFILETFASRLVELQHTFLGEKPTTELSRLFEESIKELR